MTLEELKASDKPCVTAAEVAPVLGCDPQYIRECARGSACKLGFPVSVIGKRVRIPRLPFIAFMEGSYVET